jgi:hypothetical protein
MARAGVIILPARPLVDVILSSLTLDCSHRFHFVPLAQQQSSRTWPVWVQTSLPSLDWQQHDLSGLPVKPHTTAPAKAVVATAVAASVTNVFLTFVIFFTSLFFSRSGAT